MTQEDATAQSPLGVWILSKAPAKGFDTKTRLISELKVQPSTFYDWIGPLAAVPGGRSLSKLQTVLRLTKEERVELSEKLEEQRLAHEEAKSQAPRAPRAPTAADISTTQVVEYDDPYSNRAAAIELIQDQVAPQAIAAAKRIFNSSGDLTVEEWVERIFELSATRKKIEQRATGGADVFDIRPNLSDDPKKRGKR